MRFAAVIGHDKIKEQLVRGTHDGRVSHASLFIGPEGNGGLPLALAYATYINCENPTETDSCGVCPSCQKADKLIHPDIHYSFPMLKFESGPKSQQRTICADYLTSWRKAVLGNPYLSAADWKSFLIEDSLDGKATTKELIIPEKECGEIRRRFSLKAFENGYKVLIIWMAEFLGNNGNRLLKLIEEPPEKSLFILVAEEPEKILGTIRSRTQAVRIMRYPDETISAALQQQKGLPDSESEAIAKLAEGNYRLAQQLIDSGAAGEVSLFREWVRYCLEGDLGQLDQLITELEKSGRDTQKNFFRSGLQFTRDCLIQRHLPNSLGDSQEDRLLQQLADRLSLSQIEQLTNLLERSLYYVDRYINMRILLMNVSLRFSRMWRMASQPVTAGR